MECQQPASLRKQPTPVIFFALASLQLDYQKFPTLFTGVLVTICEAAIILPEFPIPNP